MRTTTRRLLVLFGAAALAVACTAGPQPSDIPATPAPVLLPEPVGSGGIVLFNRFTQRLLTYEPTSGAVLSASTAPNFLQYGFATTSGVYTAGFSSGTGFRIVEAVGGRLSTLLELPDDQGIFPLASSGSRLLFTRSEYDAGREIGRSLVELVDGALVEDGRATGLVDSGVIVGDDLYYTVYVPATDDYTLHRLSLLDRSVPPEQLGSPLPEGGLFAHDSTVFTAQQGRLVSAGSSFECDHLCVFDDALDVLLRMRVNEQAGLSLDVVDTVSGTVLDSRTDVIDFAVDGANVVVYRTGGIDRIPVRGGRP